MKKNLGSSKEKKSRGQIGDYYGSHLKEFLAIIYHVNEESVWTKLKNRYYKSKTGDGKPLRLARIEPTEEKGEIEPKINKPKKKKKSKKNKKTSKERKGFKVWSDLDKASKDAFDR